MCPRGAVSFHSLAGLNPTPFPLPLLLKQRLADMGAQLRFVAFHHHASRTIKLTQKYLSLTMKQ